MKKRDMLNLISINRKMFKHILKENNSLNQLEITENIKTIVNYVYLFFNKNSEKTKCWFISKNIELANFTPRDMIYLGKIEKLHSFVTWKISLNYRD